ncbi:MAG: PLAT/LH2 domain-containing protein [Phycisphaerales bacterium]
MSMIRRARTTSMIRRGRVVTTAFASLLATTPPTTVHAQDGGAIRPNTIELMNAAPQITIAVDPTEVREGRPFKAKVSFTRGAKDRDETTTPGVLVVTHGASSATIDVPKLELNRTHTRTVTLTAGLAGENGHQDVDVQYYSDARRPSGEFAGLGESIGSASAPITIRAQFYVAFDRMVVGQTRASRRDVDYIWFGSSLQGGELKTTEKVMHDVGVSPHRVDLPSGPFEFVPDPAGPRIEFLSAVFIMNKGFEGSAEQKAKNAGNIITQMVGAGFGAALGSSGESGGQTTSSFGSLAGFTVKLHEEMTNNGLGADGVVANEMVRVNASLVEQRTRNGQAYEVKVPCYGLSSGDTTGSVDPSKYDVILRFHRDATVYRVRVITGDVDDAETDSHVFLTIRGERGSTEEQELDDIQRNFQRGASETFTVIGKDVGRITGIRIRHDNTFDDKSWWLQEVTVEDSYSNESASFVYNNWISATEGPKQLSVELTKP